MQAIIKILILVLLYSQVRYEREPIHIYPYIYTHIYICIHICIYIVGCDMKESLKTSFMLMTYLDVLDTLIKQNEEPI
jgi:hypothetical protein